MRRVPRTVPLDSVTAEGRAVSEVVGAWDPDSMDDLDGEQVESSDAFVEGSPSDLSATDLSPRWMSEWERIGTAAEETKKRLQAETVAALQKIDEERDRAQGRWLMQSAGHAGAISRMIELGLSPREREVILAKYSLKERGELATYRAIGALLGVSPQTAKKAEQRAHAKLARRPPSQDLPTSAA